jgi:hypothetical protein
MTGDRRLSVTDPDSFRDADASRFHAERPARKKTTQAMGTLPTPRTVLEEDKQRTLQ